MARDVLSRTFWFQQERTDANAEFSAFWGKRQTYPHGVLAEPVWSEVVLVRKANYLCC